MTEAGHLRADGVARVGRDARGGDASRERRFDSPSLRWGTPTVADHIDVLTRAIAQGPSSYRKHLLIRADGAGSSHGLLDWLTAQGAKRVRTIEYSVEFASNQSAADPPPDKNAHMWASIRDASASARRSQSQRRIEHLGGEEYRPGPGASAQVVGYVYEAVPGITEGGKSRTQTLRGAMTGVVHVADNDRSRSNRTQCAGDLFGGVRGAAIAVDVKTNDLFAKVTHDPGRHVIIVSSAGTEETHWVSQ